MSWSKERREKQSARLRGRKLSTLTIAKMSLARRGNKNTLGYHHTPFTRAKMSEAHKRRWNLSPEAKRTMSLRQLGTKNPNWQDGKSFEPYNSEFNGELKELIRLRDSYTCQLCGAPECEFYKKLFIHHIDYDKSNCLPTNLVSLCRACNSKVNFHRKQWTEYFRQHLNMMQINPKALLRDVKQKTRITPRAGLASISR